MPLIPPAVARADGIAGRFLPVASMALAVLAAVLPIRIPGYAAITPAFTLMAAYHWTIYRPDLLSPPALFVIGLAQDLLTGAALGVTSLLLLLARAVVMSCRRYFVDRLFPFVWAGFAILAAGGLLFSWALHCGLEARLIDIRGTAFRAVLTVAAFPVASFLLGRAQRALIAPP